MALVLRVLRKLWLVVTQGVSKLHLKRLGVAFGNPLKLYGLPIVSMAPGSSIHIGNGVTLISRSAYTALGVTHPVVLRTLSPSTQIVIGANVGMSGTTICSAQRVEVGANTLLGANTYITDTDFHPVEPFNRRYAPLENAHRAPVKVGNNVFIGQDTIVLKGVTTGDNSFIRARSLITKDIPANVIAAGQPCKVLRTHESAS